MLPEKTCGGLFDNHSEKTACLKIGVGNCSFYDKIISCSCQVSFQRPQVCRVADDFNPRHII